MLHLSYILQHITLYYIKLYYTILYENIVLYKTLVFNCCFCLKVNLTPKKNALFFLFFSLKTNIHSGT